MKYMALLASGLCLNTELARTTFSIGVKLGIQIKELNRVQDEDKRFKIFLFLCELSPKINRVTAVVGCAVIGHSTIGGVGLFDELLNYSKNNIDDSLIAESSFIEGSIIVTEDKRLMKKAEHRDIQVKTFEEFYSQLN